MMLIFKNLLFESILIQPLNSSKIRNDAILWIVLSIILIIAIAAYAVYCTSRGYNFGWNVRIGFPRFWETSIKCTR